ncbi:MAG: DedA family protein [Coxiellaceae bacterium]|nr:MAG: DedA family protein [Coxiellaceae bacterium]
MAFQARILELIAQYGDIAIFILFALGIIALPMSDDLILMIIGILIAKQHLALVPTLIACIGGSVVGMTVNYILGRTTGYYLLHRFGPSFGITVSKIQRAEQWFVRIGKWSLLIGYYLPGVRHLTGYIAGTARLHWATFASISYVGAIIWVCLFVALGYYFGQQLIVVLAPFSMASNLLC